MHCTRLKIVTKFSWKSNLFSAVASDLQGAAGSLCGLFWPVIYELLVQQVLANSSEPVEAILLKLSCKTGLI